MKKSLLAFGFILTHFMANAQTATSTTTTATAVSKPTTPSVTLYGFVRHDVNYDSRQSVFVREGQLLLYPKDKDMVGGTDYNKKAQLNMLGILTRVGVKLVGPDVLNAKLTGQIEGDFFGQADVNIGLLRLRHGFAKLDWTKSSLTIGQTWYPLFIPEVFPGVVNFNTGIPIAPFGWAGQMKYTAQLDKNLAFSFTAYKPREFGVPSVNPLENTNAPSMNATMPQLNAHLQYKSAKFIAGAQLDYSVLNPYTKYASNGSATLNSINNEKVTGLTFMGYTKLTTSKFSLKAQGVIGQNSYQWVMMGGYYGYKNASGLETYQPASTKSVWIDLAGTGKKVVPGIFYGFSSNDGADAGATAAYGRAIGISGRGIKNLTRISPRLEFLHNKLKFGTELEFTTATYGSRSNAGKVIGATDAFTNTRFTFSTIYSF
ncbi:MAG: hypothetical protein RIT38_157 [Bacteroidota bacterium]|jgi:hypothetical protein